MPTHIEKRGNKWCVIEDKTGKEEGCSGSRELAISHQRVLYAAKSGWKPTKKKK